MNIDEYLQVLPESSYLSAFDPKPSTGWQGIKALWYEGAQYQGKRTKVFAYIGYPQMKAGEKVPAVVLVHGGGGHAYAHWIKLWNEYGYAAIAMDTEGYFPAGKWKGLTGTEGEEKEKYVRKLYDELEEDGYTVGPYNDELAGMDKPVEEQWPYHAIVDTILAHNILRADARVDTDAIGICGVSWGSVITTLAIGYDTRYAFGIPIYGSAYLGHAVTICTSVFREARVKQLWSAQDKLSGARFPILWLCALHDAAFCSYSNSCSYLDTRQNGGYLSIRKELSHSHRAAWECGESYRFADCVLAGKEAFVKAVREPETYGENRVRISVPEDLKNLSARVIYFTEDFLFDETGKPLNESHEVEAVVCGDEVLAKIPEEAYSYYFEFSAEANGKWYISTTAWVTRGL